MPAWLLYAVFCVLYKYMLRGACVLLCFVVFWLLVEFVCDCNRTKYQCSIQTNHGRYVRAPP